MFRLAKNVFIFYTIAVIGGHRFYNKLIVFQMQNNFPLMGKYSWFLHSIEKNKRVAFLFLSFSIIFILTSQNCCV